MLENIFNLFDKDYDSKSRKEISKEIKDTILVEAKKLASERGSELSDAIIDEVSRRMIATGGYLQKFTSPVDCKWKLDSIVDNEFCAKCGSCEIVCPNDLIEFDEKPHLIGQCKRDGHGMCYEVCPRVTSGGHQISIREQFFEEYYYGKGSIKGQDGGVVTSFLSYLIENGKIDGAIVVGDNDWKPVSFVIKDKEALKDTSKSKYAISQLSALKTAGDMGLEKVAVVGLPCQIEGLRKVQYHPYLAKHGAELGYDGKAVNLPEIEYLIGLFCTEKFNFETIEKILDENEILIQDVVKFDVTNGRFIIETADKTVKTPVKDIEMASGCKFCRNFDADFADISVGSVGSDDGYSTVIIRTEKGNEIKKAIDLKEGVDLEAIDKLRNFKLNRFKKVINERYENNEFISYYWNDRSGGMGLRADGNYFIRVRAKPSGFYDVEDAEVINELVREYNGKLKLTNRGGYEIHDIKPIDVEEIISKLEANNLTTGSEGPLVRATLACPGAHNCALGLIETTPLCYELEEKFTEFPSNYKFKIAINGCPNKCSRPQLHDFGINGVKFPTTNPDKCNGCGRCLDVCKVEAIDIRGEMSYTNYTHCIGCGKCFNACPHDAKEVKFEGYDLFVGGKSGREVVEGIKLCADSADEIAELIEKVITVYNRLAIKPQKERLASTMKRVGQARFMEEVYKL